jgi:hypothetical protein
MLPIYASLALLLAGPVSGRTFNFLMHGDWGWIGANQTLVADQMGIYGEVLDAEFVIALGYLSSIFIVSCVIFEFRRQLLRGWH